MSQSQMPYKACQESPKRFRELFGRLKHIVLM